MQKRSTKTKPKKVPARLLSKVKRYNTDRAKLAKLEIQIISDAKKHGLGVNWRK
ncbi:MAG: hypothetical protein PHW36_00815 [Bacilli bacterium]|nr:hypothetical protein [Bacilli bacterium]